MEAAPGQRYAFELGMNAHLKYQRSHAVYNNLNCLKKHAIYPDFGHEYLPDSEDMAYAFLCRRD